MLLQNCQVQSIWLAQYANFCTDTRVLLFVKGQVSEFKTQSSNYLSAGYDHELPSQVVRDDHPYFERARYKDSESWVSQANSGHYQNVLCNENTH